MAMRESKPFRRRQRGNIMGWKCFREEDGEERSGAGRLKP